MEMTWDALKNAVNNCEKCALCKTRKNTVFGVGNVNSQILFVGEGPGEQEDLQGIPFVGAAGQLLDRILIAADIDKEDVYIANIIKCRPPMNRDPKEEECQQCLNYLRYQLLLIKPKIIVCLGRIAATYIIDKNFKITQQHGKWISRKNYDLIATFHPSALLRDETKKRPTWEDFKEIKRKYKSLQ